MVDGAYPRCLVNLIAFGYGFKAHREAIGAAKRVMLRFFDL